MRFTIVLTAALPPQPNLDCPQASPFGVPSSYWPTVFASTGIIHDFATVMNCSP